MMKTEHLLLLILILLLGACGTKKATEKAIAPKALPELILVGQGEDKHIEMRKLLQKDRIGIFYGAGVKDESFYPSWVEAGQHKIIFTDRFHTELFETFIFEVDDENNVKWAKHLY